MKDQHNIRSYDINIRTKYLINFTQSGKRFVLSPHYNGSNSYLIINATNVYQFKAKDSKIKDYALCLGNVSKDFSKGVNKSTFFLLNLILLILTIDIHKYLMKRTWHKKVFELINKLFTGLLTGSNHTKCISLSKQKYMAQPTRISLHANEYRQSRISLLSICGQIRLMCWNVLC